jgi:5'-nucleotidase
VVVSGHTHRSYLCDYGRINPARPFLLTSAGQYGTLLADIDLRYDTAAHRLVSRRARNVIVQGEAFKSASGADVPLNRAFPVFTKDRQVAALVSRYAALAAPLAGRQVGSLASSITRQRSASGESALGNLIADSQLEATRAPEAGGSQVAFMNPGGLRADLVVPAGGGAITYGQIFSVQPFGNNLVVKTMTGALLQALLEQQFDSGTNTVATPRVLFPSQGFTYEVDLSAPAGHRIGDMRLDGVAIEPAQLLRVTMNSFLADGGDNFSAFRQGTAALGGPLDVEAFEAYLGRGGRVEAPATDRIRAR